MASAKQTAANRENALRSSGPKNTQNVRFNALRHGLRANILVLPDEDPAEFNSLLQDMEAEWQPQTPSEYILVERMAVNYWKLARSDRREAIYRLNEMPDRFFDQSFKFQQGFERAFDRAQKALERLQSHRCAAATQDSLDTVPEPAVQPVRLQSPEPSPEPTAPRPPVSDFSEAGSQSPALPAALPGLPPNLSPVARSYFRKQSAEIEKREKSLMRDGFLRSADRQDYPQNLKLTKPQSVQPASQV